LQPKQVVTEADKEAVLAYRAQHLTDGANRIPQALKAELKLWQYHYNQTRPHQGIGNQTPMQVYRQNYALHAATRMLT